MSNPSLDDLIIGRYIARADALAIQYANGKWAPLREDRAKIDSPLVPWSREILTQHLNSERTAGHYMIDPRDNCANLMAFDIDFDVSGLLPTTYDADGRPAEFVLSKMRDAWHDRAHPHRAYMKALLRQLSNLIASAVYQELEIPVACAYSGNKGVHVYGFTGRMPAEDIRVAATLVMKAIGADLIQGEFLWRYNEQMPNDLASMTIEVFPKQDSVDDTGFGNLMALPLGTNLKNPDDPKFFIDMRAPTSDLIAVDPIWALSTPNPWME